MGPLYCIPIFQNFLSMKRSINQKSLGHPTKAPKLQTKKKNDKVKENM